MHGVCWNTKGVFRLDFPRLPRITAGILLSQVHSKSQLGLDCLRPRILLPWRAYPRSCVITHFCVFCVYAYDE